MIRTLCLALVALLLGACSGFDQQVDGFLMDQGWLVSSNTSFSNSITRDYEAWRGDSYRRGECTDYQNYNRSSNRWFDERGNRRYDTATNRGWNQSCFTQRFYPRLEEPRIPFVGEPEARPRFEAPPADKRVVPKFEPPPPTSEDAPTPPVADPAPQREKDIQL